MTYKATITDHLPTEDEWAELKNDALSNNFRPGALVTRMLGYRNAPVQLVSFPFYGHDGLAWIVVNETPGDPRTMTEVPYHVLVACVSTLTLGE